MELTASALLEDEQAFDAEEAPQSPKAELRSDDRIWLDEFLLMLQTTPAVLVINAGHHRIAESLSEVRALRGWLMGDRLNEADRRRLSAALVAEFDQQRDHFLNQLKKHVATSFELVSTKLSLQLRDAPLMECDLNWIMWLSYGQSRLLQRTTQRRLKITKCLSKRASFSWQRLNLS